MEILWNDVENPSSSVVFLKWTFISLFSLSHFQNNAFPSCLGLGLTDSSAGVFKAETNIKVRMAPVTWILLWFVIVIPDA